VESKIFPEMPKHLELQRCSFVTFAQKRKSEREREREREGGGKEKEEKATALFGTVHDRGAIAMIKRKQEGEGGGKRLTALCRLQMHGSCTGTGERDVS